MERRNRYSGRSNSSNFFWRYAKVFGARLSNSARPVPRPSEGMTIEWVEIRDRFRERREGEIYSSLVLLELVVGEEGIAGIAWTLLCGNADGIRLAAHRRRLTAKPAQLQIVTEEEYLVRVRTNVFACDEPQLLDLGFRIHILPEGTSRRIAPDEIILSLDPAARW